MHTAERNDLSSVVGKVDRILAAFDPDDTSISLADLSRRTGIAKSTLHRLSGALVEAGLLERDDRRLQLGLRVFELGQLVPRPRALRDAALPFMEDLFEAAHETVHLGVPDGIEILYLEKIEGHRRVRSPSRVAGRMPLYCTAVGKAVLAFSPPALMDRVIEAGLTPRTPYTIVSPKLLRESVAEVALTGVAFDREESLLGLGCAAAPIFGPGHEVVGALSVSGSTGRFAPDRVATAVRTASLSLSRVLGAA
jgi:IclR family transcriptional regulator, acetate operon repressor